MLEVFLNPPPLSPISFLYHTYIGAYGEVWFHQMLTGGRGMVPVEVTFVLSDNSAPEIPNGRVIISNYFPAEIVDNALKRMLPPF